MYNEAVKKEFISSVESSSIISEGYVQNVFNKVGFFEERFEKDCCNFNDNEIYECFLGLFHSSVDTLIVVKSMLSRYTNLCISKGLSIDNIDRYGLMRRFELEKCIIKKDIYVSPHKLNEQLSKIQTGCDQFLWYGVYRGLDYEELVTLSIKDIDGDTLTISGKTITDSKLCTLARKAFSEDIMENSGSRNNQYYKSEKILRPLKNAKDPDDVTRGRRRLVAQFKRIKLLLEYQGNASSLKMSGMFNLSGEDFDRDIDGVVSRLYNNKKLLSEYSYDKPRNALKFDILKYYRPEDAS